MDQQMLKSETRDNQQMSHFDRIPELDPAIFTAPLTRPSHLGEDWLEPEQRQYSREDHAIWDDLYRRQMEVLPGRAASAYLEGLKRLDLGRGGVPDFGAMSEELRAITG